MMPNGGSIAPGAAAPTATPALPPAPTRPPPITESIFDKQATINRPITSSSFDEEDKIDRHPVP
jgi:hypothetical protein